jgi:hypothetical protein
MLAMRGVLLTYETVTKALPFRRSVIRDGPDSLLISHYPDLVELIFAFPALQYQTRRFT